MSKIVSDLLDCDFCSSRVDGNCFAGLNRQISLEDVVERVRKDRETEFGAVESAELGNEQRTSLFAIRENLAPEAFQLSLIEEGRSAHDGEQLQSIVKLFALLPDLALVDIEPGPNQ